MEEFTDEDKQIILKHFFTNTDKPIFAIRQMPPTIQNYVYFGVSRFPNMRERFIKILQEHGVLSEVARAIQEGKNIEEVLAPVASFTAERNRDLYFNTRHGSTAEGSMVFVVSEANPIYATEDQQDFYFPMTTMELSTRYVRRFSPEHVYWDPTLMQSEFAEEFKEVVHRNFDIYTRGFEAVREVVHEQKTELPERVSVLDAIRFIIPIAAHTQVILGGNTRAVFEHFKKLLAVEDNFVRSYARQALEEISKVIPRFFENVEANMHIIERNKRLREFTCNLFKDEYKPVKEKVRLFYESPLEELVLTQIIYPFCNLPFEDVFDKVNSLTESERQEIFKLATEGRANRQNPIRGFETRPLVYEIESPFALWKDFKRNRMNLRFHQEMRGLAGWETPELVKNSSIAKEYEEAQTKTADLVERVFKKFGKLSRAVASQGCRKRYLLCMGPRQLTVLGELRTIGEGDVGYRRIASQMIQLAKDENLRLFGHIRDNYKKV